ncbi:terminase ATPase subunit family protein [Lysobacter sp. CA199]|uniref:terminase ATPase subunit family protein n=1 Tax=Lysobacter sp. CA199 TaxID=3455608 RepID=UPI003F8D2447
MLSFTPAPNIDHRRSARALYWQGWRITDIAKFYALARTTVESWKQRDKWDDASPIERLESSIEARVVQLVHKEPKTGSDYKEIDLLCRQIERTARVRRYSEPGGHEGDLNPKIANRNAKPKRKPVRNAFSEEQQAKLIASFDDQLFGYQRYWRKNAFGERIRNILKSRQIGATFYFAREALVDALETGRNQIFLSASKAQAHVFKQYIAQFAQTVDVDLTGDPIILPNGATLYFLGTNVRTAQSYHGNLYFDEYFWTHQFEELRKVAAGMALHKHWRQTYFSTPSSVTHQAYAFWTGASFNKGRRKEDRIKVDVSHEALRDGRMCADGQWRQIVTIEDALRQGCNLFDLDQLRLEYSPAEWANLLMCEFVDDTLSVFPLAELQRCFVDSWSVWEDFKPFALRPLGHREVWVGYDPALTGDSAGLVVVAPPLVPGGKFRVLEKHQWRGMDFKAQAERIRKITQQYNVTYIGIDATGVGAGVFPLVRDFFPSARNITYSVEVKTRMVLKAKDVIASGRLEFDAAWTDIAQAFMSIRKTLTATGRQATYEASRSDDIGHADLAWAVMHALDNEPLEGMTARHRSIVEII